MEQVVLVDSSGHEEVVSLTRDEAAERLLLHGGALWTRNGADDQGRKRFVFERSQR